MAIVEFPSKVFSCLADNINYQVKAEPIIYGNGTTEDFHSGNWNLVITSPSGEIKTSFYPEDGDMFDVELPQELKNEIIHNLL